VEASRSDIEKETGRLEAFSDGVYAIAITLLVLELKVPQELSGPGLRHALAGQWPDYAAFLVSFATIGIMWINHHRLFTLVRRVDHLLLVLNLFLLLGVTVVPFPTSLVSRYLGHDGERLAALVYAGWYVVIAIAFNVLWRYMSSAARKPALLRVPPDSPEVRAIHGQFAFGPPLYALAFVAAFWSAVASLAICGGLALLFLTPPRTLPAGR